MKHEKSEGNHDIRITILQTFKGSLLWTKRAMDKCRCDMKKALPLKRDFLSRRIYWNLWKEKMEMILWRGYYKEDNLLNILIDRGYPGSRCDRTR